jgi:hypothetical protein
MFKKNIMKYSSIVTFGIILILTSCIKEEKKELVQVSKDIAPVYEPRFNIIIKNYCVLKSTKRVAFHALNRNYHLTSKGIISDMDSDGISDADESTEVAELFGISPEKYDTIRDGYSDNIVYNGMITLQKQGELPLCSEGDLDFDGLPDCAENVLGTDKLHIDHDRDGISDELELFIGLNPLIKDSHLDTDMDGLSNYDELIYRTPINESNHLGKINIYKLQYDLVADSHDQSQDCYTYHVNNITYNVNKSEHNLVEIYFHEEVNGKPKQSRYSRKIEWSQLEALRAELYDKGDDQKLPTFIIEYPELIKKKE